VPFGTGRSDEVLYPAFLLLVAMSVASLRLATLRLASVQVQSTVAALVILVLVTFGISHRSIYPEVGLRALAAKLAPQVAAHDVVVVDGWNAYTWSYDDLSAYRVSFAPTAIPWNQGFHVLSTQRGVLLAGRYLEADVNLTSLSRATTRVWYVGLTHGGFSPSVPTGYRSLPIASATLRRLLSLGWHQSGPTIWARNVFATPLQHG
jgi:hypothetical protein